MKLPKILRALSNEEKLDLLLSDAEAEAREADLDLIHARHTQSWKEEKLAYLRAKKNLSPPAALAELPRPRPKAVKE